MPLNVRNYFTSVLLALVSLAFVASAQTVPPPTTAQATPTSGDIMRERISKSKAYIAVRNYNAAIYELENIRKESGDPAVQGVVNVLLMNSYLEQGDYKRAQELLNQFYNQQKTSKPNALASYLAVAGQVVKGARSRAERYKALGLNVGDRTLPLEALNDLEKMRETLEMVITQSKEIGGDKAKSADAMAMLEEAGNSRSMLARDDYDSRRWKDDVADTREKVASSRSVVLSAVENTPADAPNNNLSTAANNSAAMAAAMQPVSDTQPGPLVTREREVKNPVKEPISQAPDTNTARKDPAPMPQETTVAKNEKPVYVPSAPIVIKEEPRKEEPRKEQPKPEPEVKQAPGNDGTPIDVGSLVAYATRQAPAIYPPAAKSIRATGIVKVEVTVDEKGDVAEVQKTSGPTLLQGAAKDAIRKWKFKPFVRDGQPVRAVGFVSFNFAM